MLTTVIRQEKCTMPLIHSWIQAFRKRMIISRAKGYQRRGNINAAIEVLEKALKMWPHDRKLLLILSGEYQSNRDWKAFFELFEHTEEVLYPGNLWIKWRYGKALIVTSRYDEAIEKFRYVIEHWNLDDEFIHLLGNTHACLGFCYASTGECGLAKTELKAAQSLSPWDVDLLYGLILYYFGTNQLSEISALLDGQINQNVQNYTLYYWKARLTQYTFNDVEGSLKWYRESLKRINDKEYRQDYQPIYFSVLYYASPIRVLNDYVDALIQVGKSKDALLQIYWQKFRGLDGNLKINTHRIYFDILTGHAEKAELASLKKLAEKPIPDISHDYFLMLAHSQLKQGKLSEARRSIQMAIEIDPTHPAVWNILGEIEIDESNWDAGIEIYHLLVKMEPFEPEYWQRLGRCYYFSQDFEQARIYYERASTLLPYHSELWRELGDTYSALKQPHLAQSAYEKSESNGSIEPCKTTQ